VSELSFLYAVGLGGGLQQASNDARLGDILCVFSNLAVVALVHRNKDGNSFELVGRPVDFVPHINGGHTVRSRLGSLAPLREIDLRRDLHIL